MYRKIAKPWVNFPADVYTAAERPWFNEPMWLSAKICVTGSKSPAFTVYIFVEQGTHSHMCSTLKEAKTFADTYLKSHGIYPL